MDNNIYCSACRYRSSTTRKLTLEQLECYCSSKHEVSANQGEIIIKQNAPVTHMVYLKEGIVKLLKTNHRNINTTFNLIKGPCFLGLSYFSFESNHIFSVFAASKCEVCFIEKKTFHDLFLLNGEFAKAVIETIYMNEIENYYWIINLLRKSTPGRIADFLLYISSRFYDNKAFELPISKSEIAQLLNISSKSFSRVYNEFAIDNLIAANNSHIELTNPILLRKISDMS